MTGLLAEAEKHLDEWVGLLASIVDTESGPGNEVGIGRVYDLLDEQLAKRGFSSRRLATPGPDVFVANRPATSPEAPRLLLIGHADTVFAEGTVAERPFGRDGDRLTGPGVADMKGGLVVALASLALSGPGRLDSLDLTVLVNGDEESGSAESRETIERLAPDFDAAFVFEPGRPPNRIVASRRGAHRFEVVVTGKPAHTGVNPQDGANAIETAAHHILALQELGRSVPGATVTVAMISGGRRPNIVPDRAAIRVDSRFDDDSAERQVIQGVRALEGPGPVEGTATTVRSLDQRPAFQAPSERLDAVYKSVADDLGITVTSEPTGGSSDGNFTSAAGVPTLDGLGAIGHGFHTSDEYLLRQSIAERAAIFAGVLQKVSEEGL